MGSAPYSALCGPMSGPRGALRASTDGTLRALLGTRGRKVIRISVSAPDMTITRVTRAIRVIGAPMRAGGVTG
jgi:hypothetical protein